MPAPRINLGDCLYQNCMQSVYFFRVTGFLLEEQREMALARSTIYQQNLGRYHSRKVNPRVFREGDLVLRLVQRTEGRHKLSPLSEGPFIVSKALHNDAYYLIDAQESKKGKADMSGEETKRPWNIALLRPFYS